jgi:hypothetical protein
MTTGNNVFFGKTEWVTESENKIPSRFFEMAAFRYRSKSSCGKKKKKKQKKKKKRKKDDLRPERKKA